MTNPMFKISYGLYVVTANADGRDNGCVSNTLMQVTAEPNRVSLCLDKRGLTCDMIRKSGKFTASIISEKSPFELFKRFGFQSGRDVDKFEGYTACRRLDNDTMAVTEQTCACISVSVTQTVDLGSHLMFIGDVTAMEMLSDLPAATYAYNLEHIKPKPQAQTPAEKKGNTVWRCRICGHEYVGDELPADFVCPLCGHPASDFEKVER